MSAIKLNKQQTKNFIKLYHQYDNLWNARTANYSRNDLRRKSWDRLAYQLDCTVEETKKKVKYLRSAYLAEKKKVDKKKRNGETYEPNLFYYNDFYFLDGVVQQRRLPEFEERNCSAIDETSNANNILDEEEEEEEEERYESELKAKLKRLQDFDESNGGGEEEEVNNTSKRDADDEVHTTIKRIRVKEDQNMCSNSRVTYSPDRKQDLEERRFAFEREKALRELELREKEMEKDERLKTLEIESKERIAIKELELKYNCFSQD